MAVGLLAVFVVVILVGVIGFVEFGEGRYFGNHGFVPRFFIIQFLLVCFRLAVLFLDMLIGEHQLGALTGAARPSREKIDETVRLAVKVFLRGCASSGQRR